MTEHKKTRRHSKVSQLPEEVREAVHRAILSGRTYEEIVAHLKALAQAGEIEPAEVPSRSGLGRYGKDFLARMERLKIVQEQARAIVEGAEGNGLVMEEAATSMALNEVMTLLMSARPVARGEVILTPPVVAQIATAIAKIQSSSASRERVKADLKKELGHRLKGKLDELAGQAREEGARLDPETLRRVREEIYGIVEPE